MEPERQQHTAAKLDKDGEEIVMEGVCYRKGVYWEIFFRALLVSIISLIGVLILIPIILLWFARACVKSFNLHLTKKRIHYHQSHPCGYILNIPLSDITSIKAVGTDIHVYMEKRRINQLQGGCVPSDSCLSFLIPSYLVLYHVENNREFVEAVERELSTVQHQE